MEKSVYIRMRHRVMVKPNDTVTIEEIAQIIAEDEVSDAIKKIIVHQINMSDKNIVIIDVMKVIFQIQEEFPEHDIQSIGPAQTIVEIKFKKRRFTPIFFVAVWFLLFIGAALTMMNFHEDVSMREVQQRIYSMITGEEVKKPLLFQIPYSLGLGLGMILFFNHIFRKRINEEPSPLEVEMFNYQQDLDNYLIMTENKESMKQIDDH
ncbi:stage V sporulation protein AA [Ferdinandcohnia quinoae]|uniref:Stage V sporulation protein AA n=1 Tax=Fredinandcohnia quinoae TaxID=2918902 RepID=A0AAW5E5E2_9BACI|nr:stage V sporulation protein AA [Fredinandcohnia sp. SECRCQ15]MCH1624820.1 stage V sporulation protein AA [Fredinandcohnia sp. SECRCQ15]